MTRRAMKAGAAAAAAAPHLDRLRTELKIPVEPDPAALAEAERAAAAPIEDGLPRLDRRDLPLVTLDPLGSTDLDQAFHLARRGSGFEIHYAIADVASFVRPGGALDADTRQRGVTVYGPDRRCGLHPAVLSEGAASLLPDVDRRAVLWRITIDADGVIEDIDVRRALVRSVAQLDYAGVQRSLDDGTAGDMLNLLPLIGRLRMDLQIARGGATLDVPTQEVEATDGMYRLVLRAGLPVEEFNAQLSLLTGIAAARLQRQSGIGLWRTLGPAQDRDLVRLRRFARTLGLSWPAGQSYGAFARTVTSADPAGAAFATEAATLFRGAGYQAFGVPGGEHVPEGALHSAIGAEYAHVTAPLRRLVDRFGTEIALATAAGTEVPAWAADALPPLPDTMTATTRRANTFDRDAVDLLEALILRGRIGQRFDAIVTDSAPVKGDEKTVRATVLLEEPFVRTRVTGPAAALRAGTRVRVRIAAADVDRRTVAVDLISS